MTYFGFLALFLGVPLAVLALPLARRWRRQGHAGLGRTRPPAWLGILLHALIALIYTTPWDNYLVATRVWWYDPALVTGITLGYVPLEEYAFFVLQPVLSGFWLLFWAPYLPPHVPPRAPARPAAVRWRAGAIGAVTILWLAALILLASGWAPGTYLALELGWALPVILVQLWFGGDILWHNRRLAAAAILPLTLYLSAADALAVAFGTWTINPDSSLGILLGGVLPVEELVFFLLTNTLVTFGLILLLAPESRNRAQAIRRELAGGRFPPSGLGGDSRTVGRGR